MKIKILLMLLLAATPAINAQQIFSGTIVDIETAQPIAGATIYFPELEKGTVTDFDGKFSFQNLPDGTHQIIISSIGYRTFAEKITLPTKRQNFSLKPSAIEMEEVIVSTPFHQLQSENVMKVERENISELQKKGAISLSDGITQIAGVESLTTGVGIGKPVIRGLSSNRVLVYSQGVRLENQQYGDEHGLGINQMGISSVEVIKGPASLLYGSDAIGGVLYLNPEAYAEADSTAAEIDAQYYSNTIGFQGSAMAKTSGEKLKFLARGSYAAHSDYNPGDDERVTNTRFNEKDLKAGVGYQDKKYKADLRYNYNRSEIGIPEEIGLQSTEKDPLLPYQQIDNHILSLDNRLYLSNSSLDLKIGYQFNNRKEFEEHHHEEEPEGEIEEGPPALEMHLETLNYNLKYNLPKLGNFDVILGVQGMNQNNQNLGEEVLIPDAKTTDAGIFATGHYHLKSFDFQGGLRFDHRRLNSEIFGTPGSEGFIESVNRNFNSVNGAFGAKYQYRGKFIARLNFATGFRAPNLAELTSNGAHHGANRYEIGDPQLQHEQNFQTDLALEWRNIHFEAFANGFYNSVTDYIFISPTGAEIAGDAVYRYTQDNARLYGGEIGFHLHPHPLDWLHLESSFEMVTGELSNGDYLPLIPANSINNTLRVEFDQGKLLNSKYGFVRVKNVFDKTNVSEFETFTGGYTLLSAGLGGNLNLGNSNLEFSISGNNLLNRTYISHLSRLKYDGIPNIGRNIQISLNYFL